MSFEIFVPSHITGFFNIENNIDPLKNGSCGAGFLLNKGVKTKIKETSKDNIVINSSNKESIEEVLKILGINEGLKISQKLEVPIGAGFGTSASSSLGVAIGLSNVLDLNYDIVKAGQIAHLSELNLGSGLGDVIAELGKGIVIRTKSGAPGIGETISFSDEKIYVACKSFGELSTSSIIQDPKYKRIINKNGQNMKDLLLEDFSVNNFLRLSKLFSYKTNLVENQVDDLIQIFESDDDILGSSMAMLGNTAFAFSYYKDTFKSLEIEGLDVYEIDNNGIKYD